MCEELKNKIISFNKYISNQTEAEIMQEYWIDIKQVIEKQQVELEKKDKIIDEMAEQLAGLTIFDISKDEPLILGDKEEVKKYFERRTEQ